MRTLSFVDIRRASESPSPVATVTDQPEARRSLSLSSVPPRRLRLVMLVAIMHGLLARPSLRIGGSP